MRKLDRSWQERRHLQAKLIKVTLLLEKKYGIPRRRRPGNLLKILIETILSQHTNDQNRDRAYRGLKKQFPHWGDLLEGNTKKVVSAIREGGLAEQKARRIREILHWIKKREGKLSLSFLRKMDSDEIQATIGPLKGIGPKTIHCLLLFGLGREAFPVDTHILRVGKRLGFILEGMEADAAHAWMTPLVPKKKSLSLHLNLIRFGRSICKAKNPSCDLCFLRRQCLRSDQDGSSLQVKQREVNI